VKAGLNETMDEYEPQSDLASSFSLRRAFTIVELLVVITIIIVLAELILATSGYVQKKAPAPTDQPEKAIQVLSGVVKIPNGPSRGDLVGPRWDSLRSDPRFQVIIVDSARPVKI
jgi:hypothetical protein